MTAEFSHMMYDDLTDIIFVYFNNGTVQDLTGTEQEIKEFCVWMNPYEYKKLRKYIIDHPTKETL